MISVTDKIIKKLDKAPLWILVVPLEALFLVYYILLGKNVYFDINDILDESLFNYVLHGKYMFSGVSQYPEMLTGVPVSGMSISSPIFVPLYHFFPVFTAFMIQFALTAAIAYLGMYACVRKLTDSSIISVLAGAALMWLPWNPIYGLSQAGLPVIIFAFLLLADEKKFSLKSIVPYALVILYTLGAHLVWIGFVPAGALILVAIIFLVKKRPDSLPFYAGIIIFFLSYILVNLDLVKDFFVNTGFISHRTETIVSGEGFNTCFGIFLWGNVYARTLHHYLIIPIVALLVLYTLMLTVFNGKWFKDNGELREKILKLYIPGIGLFILNILIALIYGICESDAVTAWRNSQSGILKFFQLNRIYWIYFASWYIDAALIFMMPVRFHSEIKRKPGITGRWPLMLCWLFIALISLPTAWNIRQNGNWILNKSQYKNDCHVGLMSWNDFYAEGLMEDIKEYIGEDQSTYRVASLGISPAVSLEAGFYTIDGYSNNYSLEYKHAFRKVIEKELEKSTYLKSYYDTWGNRCYVFTADAPSDNGSKYQEFTYRDLQVNTDAMKELGCEYIISAAQIEDPDSLSLTFCDTFERDDSFYRLWLYKLED